MFEKDDLCERIVAEMQKTFDGQRHHQSESAVSTTPKRLNKFMIITAFCKGLTNYLMVTQFGYMI